MTPELPVRYTFKKSRLHSPVLIVELECVQNHVSIGTTHYRSIILMTTVKMVPDRTEKGRREAFS